MLISRLAIVGRWFETESSFWKLLTFVLGTFALLKGLRLPSSWALTQSELDYKFGFIKRGLPGEILHAFNIWHAREIGVVFALELALMLFLVAYLTFRSGLLDQLSGWYITAVFATSYYVTYLTHTIGFAEIPDAALAVLILLVRDTRLRFAAAIPLTAIALLIHEDFLLIFLPVVLLAFFLDGWRGAPATRRAAWIGGTLTSVFSLGLTIALALRHHLTSDQIASMQKRILSEVDFPVRMDYFFVLRLGLGGNLHLMREMWAHSYWWWAEQLLSLCIFGPVLFILLRRCYRTLSIANQSASVLRWAVALATFAPLSMHLLGLDQVRWNSMCVLNAYLCLLLINMHTQGVALPADIKERNGVILVVALNMASGYGLMGGLETRLYPFFPVAIKNIVLQHDTLKGQL